MTGTPRIDWDAARRFYIAQGPTRTLARVSEEFGVSDVSVGKRARAEGWLEQARRIDAQAAEKADECLARTYADRVVKRLEQVDLLVSKLVDDVVAGDVEIRAADFPGLIRIEELLSGRPDSRIEVREVQTLVAAIVEIVVHEVPAERRGAVLDAFAQLEGRFGELVEIGAGEEPAT